LFESKVSEFFVEAKRAAAPDVILADLRKNLANALEGK
jgi:hypothetical protein